PPPSPLGSPQATSSLGSVGVPPRRLPSRHGARGGGVTSAGAPTRSCVGCRTRRLASDLLRLVVTDGGARVSLDTRRRLPGRGAHICRDSWVRCLSDARRRRGLARALRVGNDVIEQSRLEDAFSRFTEEPFPSPPSRS
ncbi:MAG: YlxR family protein, partial [Candidatus Dormibacteria bacterium]